MCCSCYMRTHPTNGTRAHTLLMLRLCCPVTLAISKATKHLKQSRVNPKPAASFWLRCCWCRHSNHVSGMPVENVSMCIPAACSARPRKILEGPGSRGRGWRIRPLFLSVHSSSKQAPTAGVSFNSSQTRSHRQRGRSRMPSLPAGKRAALTPGMLCRNAADQTLSQGTPTC